MRNYTLFLLLFISTQLHTQNSFELVLWYLKCKEGYSSKAYHCTSKKAKKSTIGWGTQSNKKKITKKEAQKLLYARFEKDYQKVKARYPKLNKRQHLITAALMYHVGNIGKELDHRLKNGLPVSNVWTQYNVLNGRFEPSFLKRRAVEVDIFNGVNLSFYYDKFKECVCKQK